MVLNTRMLPFTFTTIVLCSTACNASSVVSDTEIITVDDSDAETITPDEIDAEDQTVEDVSDMSESPMETESTPSGPSHSSVEKQPCKICNKLLTKNYLKKHMLIHGEPKFRCKTCNHAFKIKASLERHIRGRHPELDLNQQTYSCNICGREFATKMQRDAHKNIHGDKTHECTKPNCGRRFAHKGVLDAHVRNVHERSKRVLCSICKTWLANMGNYIRHMNTVHGGKRYVCEQCPKTFTQNGRLESHVERWHPQSSTRNTAPSTPQHTSTATAEGSPQANLAECDTKEFVLRPATQSQAAADPMQVDSKPPEDSHMTITVTSASTNAISDAVRNIKEETETPAKDLAPTQVDVADHDTKDFVQEPPFTIAETSETTQPARDATQHNGGVQSSRRTAFDYRSNQSCKILNPQFFQNH